MRNCLALLVVLAICTIGCAAHRFPAGVFNGSWGASGGGDAQPAGTMKAFSLSGTTDVSVTPGATTWEISVLGTRLLAKPQSEGSDVLNLEAGQKMKFQIQGEGEVTFVVSGQAVVSGDDHIRLTLGGNSDYKHFQVTFGFEGNRR